MTVYEKHHYNTNALICKHDLTCIRTRCPACEKLVRYTKHSRAFPYPRTTWRHIQQCSSYNLIPYPTKHEAIKALEEICLAIKHDIPLTTTLGYKLGMVVE